MNAESIRHLANEREVYISALYLKTPRWKKYAQIGERQFQTLSRNPNVQPGHENFRFIDAQDTAVYRAAAQGLTDGIIECVSAAQSHRRPPSAPSTPAGPDGGGGDVGTSESAENAGRELANKMFHGALVEWLARKDAAQVPRDVTVWAADKDLADPAIQTLDVQIFLTKNQLDSLKIAVDQYLQAGRLGKMTGQDFFEALRAVVAAAARTPDQMRNADTLVKTGLVPGFLKGLPYHSTLMEMNDETWSSMSPDAQDQFLKGVESKLQFYKEIHDNSEKWQPLNEGDDRDDWVANIPLEELP
jgi:serine/threonine-protein kinase PpkA